MRFRLQWKITSAIFATFVFIASVFGAVQRLYYQQRLEALAGRIETVLENLVDLEKENLANEIFENRVDAIELRLEQLLRVDGIESVAVFDVEGMRLVSMGIDTGSEAVPLPSRDRLASGPAIGRLDHRGLDHLSYTAEIEAIGEKIGYIRILHSLADAEREHRLLFVASGATLAAVFVALILVLNLFLARRVIRPITRLRDLMEDVGSEGLGRPVGMGEIAGGPADEIGDLYRAFDRMTSQLAESYREVRQSRARLEQSGERLFNERERLRITLRSIGEGVVATDTGGRVELVNRSAETFCRRLAEETEGKSVEDVLVVADENTGEPLPNPLYEAMETGRPVRLSEDRVMFDFTGSPRYIVASAAPIVDNAGKVAGGILVFRDVTERRKTELEMSRIRSYLRNIIDSMPSMLISVAKDGAVTEWNQAASEITGIGAAQAMGKKFWEIAPFLEKYRKHYRDVWRTKRAKVFHRESIEFDKPVFHDVYLFPLTAEGADGVVIRLDDASELEEKERQLRRAQKMETVGTLAGGLAHDFNNVLGGILGAVSLLQFRLETGGKLTTDVLRKYLSVSEKAAERGADMVRQLLTVAMKKEMATAPVDLNLAVNHVLKIARNTFEKSVAVKIEPSPEPAVVSADPTQLEQVLLNLCINGYHAMTIMRKDGELSGGELTVSLEKIAAGRFFCSTHPEAVLDRQYWIVSVQDQGVGMDGKTMAKIFDPFFTTKRKGKGAGLGLAVVYNIVRRHDGFIDVYSEPGAGSTFNVYFPAGDGGESADGPVERAPIPMGGGLLLVVEDEETIRETAKAILEELGYEVLTAKDGAEGLTLFERHRERIRAVLLDLVMPGLSGVETYAEMKKADPGVKVLLASGYRQDRRVKKALSMGVDSFITKPFTLEKLARAMDRVVRS